MLMQADFIMSLCELMIASQGNPLRPIERSFLDCMTRQLHAAQG